MKLKCEHCNKEYEGEFMYCPDCGERLVPVNEACDELIPSEAPAPNENNTMKGLSYVALGLGIFSINLSFALFRVQNIGVVNSYIILFSVVALAIAGLVLGGISKGKGGDKVSITSIVFCIVALGFASLVFSVCLDSFFPGIYQ